MIALQIPNARPKPLRTLALVLSLNLAWSMHGDSLVQLDFRHSQILATSLCLRSAWISSALRILFFSSIIGFPCRCLSRGE
jgi:hypothetical protein